MRQADSGAYTCLATNPAGSALHRFQLSVTDIQGRPLLSDALLAHAVSQARIDVRTHSSDSLAALFDRRRPRTMADLLKLVRVPRPDAHTLDEEVYERALDIVFRYAAEVAANSSGRAFVSDELLDHRQLRRISDLSGCHRHKAKVDCGQVGCVNRYRTLDGTCNNLKDGRKGAANTGK